MSNAARLEIPGTGDDGKFAVYDESGDDWVLSGGTITPSGTNLAALQAAVTAAVAGDTVRLTPGTTYTHADVWDINKAGITVDATGAIIVASDETQSAIWLSGDNVTWIGGTLQVATTSRGDTLDHHRLVINASDGARIHRPRIEGSKATGIFVYGGTNFVVDRPVVLGTEADTIHVTAASTDGFIVGAHCHGGGDDGVAIVSYSGDGATCERIHVVGCEVWEQVGGRGLTVVGGEDVSFDRCKVVGSNGAALYVAAESALGGTRDVAGVHVTGLIAIDSNRDASLDHGVVTIVAERTGSTIDDVTIEGAILERCRAAANGWVRVLEPGGVGTVSNVAFDRVTTISPGPTFFDWDDPGDTTITNLTELGDPATVAASAQTASYTLALDDAGKAVTMTVATANNLTVPPNSSVAFPVGTVVSVEQHGAGQTSIVEGAGVTVNSRGGLVDLAGQWAVASLRKTASDTWLLTGDLS